mgnify:CR=1 FL=1
MASLTRWTANRPPDNTASTWRTTAPDSGVFPIAAPQPEQMPGDEMRQLWRIWFVVVVFAALAGVVILQLLRYQLLVSPPPRPEIVHLRNETRGLIVDRDGTPLVVNRYYYQLAATPSNIERPEHRHEVAQQLQDLLGIPYAETYATLDSRAQFRYAVLAQAITQEDVDKLNAFKAQLMDEFYAGTRKHVPLNQVYPEVKTRRYYPQAELTSHVLGFEIINSGGKTGIEEFYNDFLLRGGIGVLSDHAQPVNTLPLETRRFIPSPVAKDLLLSIDTTVQWILRDELARGLVEYKAGSGTAIALDPRTGAILGMVNLPDYDPNRWQLAADGSLPNPAVTAIYEPGSVFKIITMAAAMDADLIHANTIYTDTGSFTIGGRVIFNSNRMAHGAVTVTDALARSLNVVTAEIAQDLGADRFYRYIQRFGFGEPTNVDLSGEIAGLVKTPKTSDWSLSDLGTNSFGQGLAVTPLQMVNATAVIANGGKLMRPYVVAGRIIGDRVQMTEPVVIRQVLRPEVAAEMAAMMAEVVETGNSKAAVPGYRVGGKSGTAQIPDLTTGRYVPDATIVTFVGFAPADDPQIVVLVKMDRPDPSINQWASHTAAPVFSRITGRLLDYLNVPPDDIRLAARTTSEER